MKIISVDSGKHKTKAIMDNKQINFRTKIQEVEKTILDTRAGSFNITYKDKNYLLGDGAKLDDFDTTKKKLQHKLSVYAASTLLNPINESISLVVLSPLSVFMDKDKREEFRQYILDNHTPTFILEDKKRTLKINDVNIFGETVAAAFTNNHLFKNKPCGIIDTGGLNVNGIVLNNMSPITGTEFTINQGGHLISEKIRKELNKQLEINIQEYQMDHILKINYHPKNKEKSSNIIKSILSDHFTEIINTMKANNWDIEGLDIVVTGGGSLLLGMENIKEYLPNSILSKNPVWDNCEGAALVGQMLYG